MAAAGSSGSTSDLLEIAFTLPSGRTIKVNCGVERVATLHSEIFSARGQGYLATLDNSLSAQGVATGPDTYCVVAATQIIGGIRTYSESDDMMTMPIYDEINGSNNASNELGEQSMSIETGDNDGDFEDDLLGGEVDEDDDADDDEEDEDEEDDDDDGKNKKKKGVKWTKDRTYLLIAFLKSVKKRFFGSVKKKIIWEEFVAKYKFCTWKKVASKYKQLVKTYRRNKKRKGATGGGPPIEWEYYDAMDDLLGDRDIENPPRKSSLAKKRAASKTPMKFVTPAKKETVASSTPNATSAVVRDGILVQQSTSTPTIPKEVDAEGSSSSTSVDDEMRARGVITAKRKKSESIQSLLKEQAEAAQKREDTKIKILEKMQADKQQLTQTIIAWMAATMPKNVQGQTEGQSQGQSDAFPAQTTTSQENK